MYFISLVAQFKESYIVDFEDFLVWQSGGYFFDFEDIDNRIGGLNIGQERKQSVFTLEHMCFLTFLQNFHLFLERARQDRQRNFSNCWLLRIGSILFGLIRGLDISKMSKYIVLDRSDLRYVQLVPTRFKNHKYEIPSRLLSLSCEDSRTTLDECLGRTRWSSSLDLTTYLYYFYKWLCSSITRSHVLLLECSVTCSYYVICLFKFPRYLYLDPIVHLDVRDQLFECAGNSFLPGALITWPPLQDSSS